MDRSLRALNRFGLGARPGEREGLTDPAGWLARQLEEGPEPLERPEGTSEPAALVGGLRDARRSRDQERLAEARSRIREHQLAEAGAVLSRRARTERPFVERLVAFWSNHLCVSGRGEAEVGILAGDYERTVIRPHVLGRFEDMVLASAKHPAMSIYLDNFRSVGPGSPAGRRSGRRGGPERGLNENYARELLELHTVGVEGGYGQEDVEQLARILTGWSVGGIGPGLGPRGARGGGIGFVFRGLAHEPGAKTVMGRRYREAGVEEGEAVLRDLCAHPSTARFVAGKLVRHFVSDDPPPDAVERLAAVFASTGGDLGAVSHAIVGIEEAWSPERRKLRSPQDWLVATFRALGAESLPPRGSALLQQLRHPLWGALSPKGFGDGVVDWADPDALLNRAELARSLTRQMARTRRTEPASLLDTVDVVPSDPLVSLLRDRSIPGPERLALAVGGPAFQWR